MRTGNLSREFVSKFPFRFSEPTWLISICDHEAVPIILPEGAFQKVLSMQFNDIDFKQWRSEPETAHKAINLEQGKQIADFIHEAEQLKANLFVNCHFGICRSGAIVELLVESGWTMLDEPVIIPRIPNRLVFEMVRKNMQKLKWSWEQ